jgi:hypothetical protein
MSSTLLKELKTFSQSWTWSVLDIQSWKWRAWMQGKVPILEATAAPSLAIAGAAHNPRGLDELYPLSLSVERWLENLIWWEGEVLHLMDRIV